MYAYICVYYISILASHTWMSPTLRGEGPEAREGHNAALVGRRLLIFGGCGKSSSSNDEVYYNDLYVLNTGKISYIKVLINHLGWFELV